MAVSTRLPRLQFCIFLDSAYRRICSAPHIRRFRLTTPPWSKPELHLLIHVGSRRFFREARSCGLRPLWLAISARLASVWTLAHWHLPGNALVEFVFRHRLGLRFVLVQGGALALHLPERGRTGFHQAWRGGRFARVLFGNAAKPTQPYASRRNRGRDLAPGGFSGVQSRPCLPQTARDLGDVAAGRTRQFDT